MIFDFLWKKKPGPQTKPAAQRQDAQAAAAPAPKAKETVEQRIEREMAALPGFVRNKIKDPAVKQKFIDLAKRMENDGVDMNSPRAMKKWVKEHEKELKEEQASGGKVETVVKTAPEVGRNDACPCGSGKKYKKCCGA
ncbi:MAG: SEC-C domain-containing protein [Syntrophomonadaceae bacterium]|jgi:preprotein translocase subunit SecA|nr:SEC-C domain-containing protein [Syntrophomonadaceae bacterium]